MALLLSSQIKHTHTHVPRTWPVVGIFTPLMLDASPSARIVPFVPTARMYLRHRQDPTKRSTLA